MINENNIKEDLLRQADQNNNKEKTSIQEIIARDAKRVKRLKLITIVSWSITVLLIMSVFIIQKVYGKLYSPVTEFQAVGQFFVPILIVIFRFLLIISVFLNISLYVRSKNLSIKQINARLANIEEQLKNVLQSK